MLTFLVLHIIALLCWLASLLYLPLLLRATSLRSSCFKTPRLQHDSVARLVFTTVATPAALLAIIFGTLIFLLQGNASSWLMVKLALVAALVVIHVLTGLLIVRAEESRQRALGAICRSLFLAMLTLMAGILWLVLAKPAIDLGAEGIPWRV